MIEIRPARPGEETRQKELWKLSFGDDDAYIDYFYTHRPAGVETLVLLEDGALETMVALFPVTLSLPDGAQASSAYIYALATHPGARKKGFGRFILNYVDFYLQEKKLDCVTIVPAEASLHRFFAAAGFSECFATRKVELLQYMARAELRGGHPRPRRSGDVQPGAGAAAGGDLPGLLCRRAPSATRRGCPGWPTADFIC